MAQTETLPVLNPQAVASFGAELLARLNAVVGGLWRRRMMVIMPMVIFPIFGFVYGVTTDKVYRTYSTVLVQEASMQNPTLEDISVKTNLKDRMPALRQLAYSRHVLQKVGVALGDLDEDDPDYRVERYVDYMSARLAIQLYGSDTVRLSLIGGNPAELPETLRHITRYFIERIVEPEQSAIASSQAFLTKQLTSKKIELDRAAQALADFKSLNASHLPSLHAANVGRLTSLREDLVEKQTELAGVRAEYDAIRQKLLQTNPMVAAIEQELATLKAERARLQARYTDSHSAVLSLTRQIDRLDAERVRVLQSAEPLTEEDLDNLFNLLVNSEEKDDERMRPFLTLQLENLHLSRQRVLSLEQEIAITQATITDTVDKVSAVGAVERELNDLQRAYDVQQTVYGDLQERFERASITRELGIFEEAERVKIIDAPHLPGTPINMPTFMFILFGIAGGLGFGIGLAFLLELLDMRIYDKVSLERILDAPVLGRLPHEKELAQAR